MQEKTPVPAYLTIAFIAFLAIVPLQTYINGQRKAEDLEQSPRDLLEVAGTVAIGGFRGVVVDLLWIRAENMRMNKQWYELLSLYDLISKLQPHFTEVWIYSSWNMAWNIAHDWPSVDDKWLWVKKGIQFAWRGERRNPQNCDMWFWVAWIHWSRFDWVIFRKEALILQKKFYAWKHRRNLAVAAQAMKKAVELMPNKRHDKPAWERVYCHILMKLAAQLEKEGKYKQALDVAKKGFLRWKKIKDMYSKAWTHRQLCLTFMNRAADVVARLEKKIEQERYNPAAP